MDSHFEKLFNDHPRFRFALREDLQGKSEFIPARSESKATGWDVRCAEPDGIILKPFEKYKIRLGFRALPPEGFWFELKPRSSSFTKKNLHFLYGTVDETFENEVMACFMYIPEMTYTPVWHFDCYPNKEKISHYRCNELDGFNIINGNASTFIQDAIYPSDAPRIEFGDRIGQIIPVKRQEMFVQEVSNEEYDQLCAKRGGERGEGGFGSTGDK